MRCSPLGMTNPMVPAASYPPLHRTQERGTHSSGTGTKNTEGWATRPAYAPFGEPYAESGSYGDLSFTGANKDTLWLDYDFMYREYDPKQGRWIGPDPAGLAAVDPTTPQSWNRYAYVNNNPLGSVDPLGLDTCYDENGNTYNCTPGGTPIIPPESVNVTDTYNPLITTVAVMNAEIAAIIDANSGSAANNGTQPPGVPKPPNPILQYDKCVTQNVNPAKNNAQKVSIINGVTNLNGLGLCAFTGPDAPLCVGVLGGVATVNSLVFWAGGQITVYDAETQCLQQN